MSLAYLQAYKNNAVQTSPSRLLIMLYDGLVRFIETACEAIEEQRNKDAHEQLVKAENVVLELKMSLNMEYQISNTLVPLYDFFYRRLIDADVNKDTQPLMEMLPIIKSMRETWHQASLIVARESNVELLSE